MGHKKNVICLIEWEFGSGDRGHNFLFLRVPEPPGNASALGAMSSQLSRVHGNRSERSSVRSSWPLDKGAGAAT